MEKEDGENLGKAKKKKQESGSYKRGNKSTEGDFTIMRETSAHTAVTLPQTGMDYVSGRGCRH